MTSRFPLAASLIALTALAAPLSVGAAVPASPVPQFSADQAGGEVLIFARRGKDDRHRDDRRGRGRGRDDAPDAGDDDGTPDQGSGDAFAPLAAPDATPLILARGGRDDDRDDRDDRGGRDDRDDRGGRDDRDDDHGRGRGRGRGRGGDDDVRGGGHHNNGGSGSGRSRPRIPGGSGCDDPGDILEHAECSG